MLACFAMIQTRHSKRRYIDARSLRAKLSTFHLNYLPVTPPVKTYVRTVEYSLLSHVSSLLHSVS